MTADTTLLLPPLPVPDQSGPMRVLVVEDNPDTARSLAMLLDCFGYEACVALDGPAALKAAAEYEPDVVLLDLGLPGMDGWKVARRLRERAKIKQPLFIAVTGYGQEEDHQRSAEAGIDLHLLKPIDPAVLEGVLKRFQRVISG